MTQVNNFPSHIIDGLEISAGNHSASVESVDPYTGERFWTSPCADATIVDRAVAAAKVAQPKWRSLPVTERAKLIERFTEIVKARTNELANTISRENGKPLWDARTEVNSLVTKLAASSEAYEKRASEWTREVRGLTSRTRFIPHGVMAVLGPFNFPMSMANSHIMPALYAGNTVVFKPSELTPICGILIAQIWQEAGLPPGVLNCISGGRDTGELLIQNSDLDGVLFIGSHAGGIGILRSLVEHPEKIVALEMGGNSPLVVWDYDDVDVAVHIALQSSIITAGQRCSAARRLIVRRTDSKFIERLIDVFERVRIGHYLSVPEPFYGPLIRPVACERMISRWSNLANAGAMELLAPKVSGPIGTLVSPALIDVSACSNDADEEIFGPFVKVIRVDNLDEAIAISNRTKFGLAAGIITRERGVFDRYFNNVSAGIINWNQQLTGATTLAPFGGAKQSGNFRSAGYMSVDYCSYPIASFEIEKPIIPASLSPGITL